MLSWNFLSFAVTVALFPAVNSAAISGTSSSFHGQITSVVHPVISAPTPSPVKGTIRVSSSATSILVGPHTTISVPVASPGVCGSSGDNTSIVGRITSILDPVISALTPSPVKGTTRVSSSTTSILVAPHTTISVPVSSSKSTRTTAVITTGAPTVTPPAPTVSSFLLHPNGNNEKCLDVRGAVFENGTPVQIFDCNGTPAQNWIIEPGQGSVVLAGTRFCLDAGSSPANGVGMKIWECFTNLPAQDWYYTADDRIALTNQGFCLDLTNGVTADGNRVQTWKCTDNDVYQVWTVTPSRSINSVHSVALPSTV